MTDLEQLVGKLNAHVEKEECLMMWTPYADREFNRRFYFSVTINLNWTEQLLHLAFTNRGTDGEYISLEDNSKAQYLPWQG